MRAKIDFLLLRLRQCLAPRSGESTDAFLTWESRLFRSLPWPNSRPSVGWSDSLLIPVWSTNGPPRPRIRNGLAPISPTDQLTTSFSKRGMRGEATCWQSAANTFVLGRLFRWYL